jgi:DNA-binding beta-propeller fold protein YncE
MAAERPVLADNGFQYEVLDDWVRRPTEIELGEVAAVAVDDRDIIYLFTRGQHPIVVLNRGGDVLRTWGHGVFTNAHGLDVGPDGSLYCTDHFDHTVRRFTSEGRLLLQIGIPGKPAPYMSGEPFCQCTHTALSPKGEIYVSDGYGNACVHKFSPDGRYLQTWGQPGCAPGEFYLPHNIACDSDGWVYVADRENHRVQVFDSEGRYETQWNNLHRPCALHRSTGNGGLFYIGELGPFAPFHRIPNLGPRLVVMDAQGRPLAHLSAGTAGIGEGRFIAPHGLAVDSHGDIYMAEVSYSAWHCIFPETPRPAIVPTIRKLRRIA